MKKILKIVVILVAILILLAGFFYLIFPAEAKPAWGVSFSWPYARYLGLDWKQTYLDILNELKPKQIRFMAYWEELEPQKGQFNFQDIDFILQEAQSHQIKILFVVGHKQPRWPECHHPSWFEDLSTEKKSEAILEMIKGVVNHVKSSKAIYAWQLENEPFFNYGPDCPPILKEFYEEELIALRQLDNRPIIITDSGEKGWWQPSVWSGADIFGSTMYRTVYHDKKHKYLKYPLPAFYYRVRAGMIVFSSKIKTIIGTELQAEPWFETDIFKTSWEKQEQLMNPNIFYDNINYARRSGFKEHYFWGAEWWYWAKAQGHNEMWESAKKFLTNL